MIVTAKDCIFLESTLSVHLNLGGPNKGQNQQQTRPQTKPRSSPSANKSECSASLSATGAKPPATAVYLKDGDNFVLDLATLIARAVIENHANAGEFTDLLVFSRLTAAPPGTNNLL